MEAGGGIKGLPIQQSQEKLRSPAVIFWRVGTEENMKTCFGKIYPDLEQFHFGRPLVGKVFQVSVDTIGPGQRDRKLTIDRDAWQDCRRCEDFNNCFEFSNAKLQMQLVLRDL